MDELISKVVETAGKLQALATAKGHRLNDDAAFIAAGHAVAAAAVNALAKLKSGK